MNYITGTLYTCPCGYKTLSAAGSLKHSKTKKCSHYTMVKKEMRFVSEEDLAAQTPNDECTTIKTSVLNQEREEDLAAQTPNDECTTIKTSVLNQEREQHAQLVSQLKTSMDAMNGKFRRALAKMSKSAYIDEDIIEDELGSVFKDGLIYFITDKDVPDRGKIGRTMNTDVKRLKSRYSIFGKPDILCYFSSDINADEAALKKLMREAGCMESNTEMISNVSLARRVFYEFVEK